MDWTQVAVDLVLAVTPVVTFVLLWALKNAWAKVPASVVLFLSPVLGIAVNFALNWYSGHPLSSPIGAAVAGLLAVVLREFISSLSTKGISGSVTVTKGML